MKINKRIQKLRKQQNLTRKEVCKNIISYSHYCNFESDNYNLSDDVLVCIAGKLKVPKSYLLDYKKRNNDLWKLLSTLHSNIENNAIDLAKKLIDQIKQEYKYIDNLEEEIYFLLLDSYCNYKEKNCIETIRIFKEETNPLVDESKISQLSIEIQQLFYYIKANILFYSKDYLNCYKNYKKQLSYAKAPFEKANINYNMAITLYNLNKIQSSIVHAKYALGIYLYDHKWRKLAMTYNLLGTLHWENNELNSAIDYLDKALELANQYYLRDLIGRIYHNMGLVFQDKKEYNKSLQYLNESIQSKKNDNCKSMGITYFSIIEVLIILDDIDGLRRIIEEAKINLSDDLDLNYTKKGQAFLFKTEGNLRQYEKYMESALKFFLEANITNIALTIANELASYFEDKRCYKKSCNYYKISLELMRV